MTDEPRNTDWPAALKPEGPELERRIKDWREWHHAPIGEPSRSAAIVDAWRAMLAARAALVEKVRRSLLEMGEWAAHETALHANPDDGPDSLDIHGHADALLSEEQDDVVSR